MDMQRQKMEHNSNEFPSGTIILVPIDKVLFSLIVRLMVETYSCWKDNQELLIYFLLLQEMLVCVRQPSVISE